MSESFAAVLLWEVTDCLKELALSVVGREAADLAEARRGERRLAGC
jgi:hypothetical protein